MFLRAAHLKKDDIGGGVVRTAFRMGGTYMMVGTKLSADEVMSINPPNRMALIDKGYIAVWPKSGDVPVIKGKRYAIHIGGGGYDVIEGRKLNNKPLSRDEARELAASGKPPN
jgi:hypothetical protein